MFPSISIYNNLYCKIYRQHLFYLLTICHFLLLNKVGAEEFEIHGSGEYKEIRFDEILAPVYFKMVDEKIAYSSDERKVFLTWVTSGKPEDSHFEIERADDRNLDFKKIGNIPVLNWDGEEVKYQFEDGQLPIAGGRIYYRIKQLGKNGNLKYGKVLSVEVNPSTYKSKGVWHAFPNPTKNGNIQIGLQLTEEYSSGEITVRVIKEGDVLLHKKCFDLDDLNNFLAQNFKNISPGLVFVELNWGSHRQFLKVLNHK